MNIKYARYYDDLFKVGDVCIFRPDKYNIRLKNKTGKQCKIESINGNRKGIEYYVVSFFVDMWQQNKEYYVVKETELEVHPNVKKNKELKLKMRDIDPYGEEDWMRESVNESLDGKKLEIGDVLVHPTFGEGVITGFNADREVAAIEFKNDRTRAIRLSVVRDMYKKGEKDVKEEEGKTKWFKKGKLHKEEDWTNESKRIVRWKPKYKIGDDVYCLSSLSMLSRHNGKNKIIEVTNGTTDYYYEMENKTGKIKWMREDDLFPNENEMEKERARREKDILDYRKKQENLKKAKEELSRKRGKMMLDVDPWGEEDWSNESISTTEDYELKIGDVCVLKNGSSIGIDYRDGKKCTITKYRNNISGDDDYYVMFDDRHEFICYRRHLDLIDSEMRKSTEKKRKELNKKMIDVDPYEEEDWLIESSENNFKVGEVCVMINGDKIGIIGRDGQKCKIFRTEGRNNCYIEFDDGQAFVCYRENLITELEYSIIDNKRKEINKKMIDVDPYEEEDWLSERRISYKKKLCPVLWEDGKIKERIRLKLMRIANDFFDDIELDVELLDVYLTGSIANYSYNADSDIDVHLIIDYSDINEDTDLVEKAVDGERYVWNLRHNIIIQEHDVELYVQDINAKHASSGIYSLMNDKWIKKPVYNRPNMDQVDVDNKYDIRVKDILRFEKISKEDLTPDEAEEYYKSARQLKKRIQKDRTEGLNIIGEFSLENLVFKKLRKTGKFGKLIDAITRLYDKIYSQ